MGWADGSWIADRIWEKVRRYIKIENYKIVSKSIYKIFEEYDADDWGYQLQSKDSLYYTYLSLNKPKQLKEEILEYG